MDIKHLEYFLTIVENNCNLSRAAERLYVSQPSLSKFIIEFEEQEEMELFKRYKNRLIALTPEGKEFYSHAKEVVESYNRLMQSLTLRQHKNKGTVRIGIPPVILTVLFKEAIPMFIIDNPNIELLVIEAGAYELQKMLLLQKIDIAILISPITIPNIEHKIIYKDTVALIFNHSSSLAQLAHQKITMKDLADKNLVILNDSFLLHHQIMRNLSATETNAHIIFQSGSWDLLTGMCESMDVATILPKPIIKSFNTANSTLLSQDFDPIFPWTVELCKLSSGYHTKVVEFAEKYFTDFLAKKTITDE